MWKTANLNLDGGPRKGDGELRNKRLREFYTKMLFTLNSHIQPQYNMSNQSTWIHLQQVIKKIINEDTNKLSTFNLDGTMVFVAAVAKAGSAVTPLGCKCQARKSLWIPPPLSPHPTNA